MSLCLSCGMCCDGTMFEVAAITPEEAARFEGRLHLTDDRQHLRLPCPALDGCRCTTYLDRPKVCGAFKCLVLASLDSGEITDAEAHAAIDDLLGRRRRVAEAVGTTELKGALELARQQIAAGTASEEVVTSFRRFRQALLLLQLEPKDSIFKGSARDGTKP